MSTRDNINNHAEMLDAPVILLEPKELDDAIIGVCETTGVVAYDRMRLIDIFMSQGMDREEAEEHFQFNTLGTHVDGYPIFIDPRYAE